MFLLYQLTRRNWHILKYGLRQNIKSFSKIFSFNICILLQWKYLGKKFESRFFCFKYTEVFMLNNIRTIVIVRMLFNIKTAVYLKPKKRDLICFPKYFHWSIRHTMLCIYSGDNLCSRFLEFYNNKKWKEAQILSSHILYCPP